MSLSKPYTLKFLKDSWILSNINNVRSPFKKFSCTMRIHSPCISNCSKLQIWGDLISCYQFLSINNLSNNLSILNLFKTYWANLIHLLFPVLLHHWTDYWFLLQEFLSSMELWRKNKKLCPNIWHNLNVKWLLNIKMTIFKKSIRIKVSASPLLKWLTLIPYYHPLLIVCWIFPLGKKFKVAKNCRKIHTSRCFN